MLDSAVGPSSQGVRKTRWSLAEIAVKPQARAVSTAFPRRSSESGSSPNRIRGRWTPRSTARSSQLARHGGGRAAASDLAVPRVGDGVRAEAEQPQGHDPEQQRAVGRLAELGQRPVEADRLVGS